MQIRERNEEGMGRGRKKTDYGGFFVINGLESKNLLRKCETGGLRDYEVVFLFLLARTFRAFAARR